MQTTDLNPDLEDDARVQLNRDGSLRHLLTLRGLKKETLVEFGSDTGLILGLGRLTEETRIRRFPDRHRFFIGKRCVFARGYIAQVAGQNHEFVIAEGEMDPTARSRRFGL